MTDWEDFKARTAKRNAVICRLRSEGATIAVLARKFRVTRQRIEQIVKKGLEAANPGPVASDRPVALQSDDSDARAALNRFITGGK